MLQFISSIIHYTLPLFADLPASTRPPLQQMATIDLGSLRLALETEVTSRSGAFRRGSLSLDWLNLFTFLTFQTKLTNQSKGHHHLNTFCTNSYSFLKYVLFFSMLIFLFRNRKGLSLFVSIALNPGPASTEQKQVPGVQGFLPQHHPGAEEGVHLQGNKRVHLFIQASLSNVHRINQNQS